MSALPTSVAMRDIRDVGSFVTYHVRRTGLQLTPDERDDLICEGLAVLTRMDRQFDPARSTSFRGYANQYLPGKIVSAWHRSCEHHSEGRDPETGQRAWQYREPAISFDALGEAPGDDY